MIKGLYHANNNVIEIVSTHIKSIIDIDNKYNDSTEVDSSAPEKDLDTYLTDIDLNEFNATLNVIAEKNIKHDIMLKGINELKFIYYNLMCNYEYIYQIRSIVICLKQERDKKINFIKPMNPIQKKQMIDNMVNETVKDVMLGF